MNKKFKRIISKVFLWDLYPTQIKYSIQSKIYSIKRLRYSYDNGIFLTSYQNQYVIKTHEPPFAFKCYFDLFFKDYLPKKGDIVIDAGGFNGHISCFLSALVGVEGKVFVFEPDKSNFNKCESNISLNKCENIQLIPEGLWSSSTQIEFYSNASVASSAFFIPDNSTKITIEVTSLDEYVKSNNIKSLDFIKMNIEGSEIEAIKGAVFTLNKLKPRIAITADHTVNGRQTYEFVKELLLQSDYSVRIKRVGRGSIVVIGSPLS